MEGSRCCCCDDTAAKSGLKADTFPFDITTGIAKDCQDFGIITEFHAGFGKNPVGIGFDYLKPFFGKYRQGADLTIDERRMILRLITAF